MAPQTDIPPAATALGIVCWCVQLIPQIYTSARTKSTTGLPATMMLLWAASAVPLGTYSIAQSFNLPVQIQPQVFGALSTVSWAQILHYTYRWPWWRAAGAAGALAALAGGIEALLVLTLRPVYRRGVEWPITFVGVLAAVLMAAGLLPPYWEIYKRRGRVVGISMLFLFTDWLGAFFSLMSLVAQRSFDVLGGVQYAVCAALEVGIFTLWLTWLLRTWRVRREAKDAGMTYDEYVEKVRKEESS